VRVTLNSIKKASLIAGFLVLLTACQTPPHTKALLKNPPNIAPAHQIQDVPFYPQQAYYCGPTTLAEVANFYGQSQTPDAIAPNLFIPERKGSLQLEMKSAARQLDLLAYTQNANLNQLLTLVSQNVPVIVLQNNGIELMPKWHYAVVVGYDLAVKEVILHTGVTKNYRLNFATFERTWQRANYWMLVAMPPDITVDALDAFIYIKAGQSLLDTQRKSAGEQALKAAMKQWPEYWLSYFLLANYKLTDSLESALYWYQLGLKYASQEPAYLNNYAYALGQANCFEEANRMINKALTLAPGDPDILDTQAQLQRWQSQAFSNRACNQVKLF